MSRAARRPRRERFEVFVSTAWSLPLGLPGTVGVRPGCTVEPRAVDWGRSGWAARLHRVGEAVRVAWRARRHRALVVCNAGVELVVIGVGSLVVAPRQRRVVIDFLMPSSRRVDRLVGMLLRPWVFGCIRSADRAVLTRRFGIPAERSAFVPFPVWSDGGAPVAEGDDGSVYAGGAAHRDWPTFFAAMALVDAPVTCAIGIGPVPPVPAALAPRLTLHPPEAFLSPADGRARMARASVVVVPMVDTDLPAGPLVLLDALALGKAVVATDTAGTRDYVDGDAAVLVPPGDAAAMADAVRRLLADPGARAALGARARAAAGRLTPERFAGHLFDLAGVAR